MVQGSVSGWISRIGSDRELAADHLWKRFRQRLTNLARWALGDAPRVLGDEDDIAAIAFAEVMRGSEANRLAGLATRDDLWRVLSCTVTRRARDYRRRKDVRDSWRCQSTSESDQGAELTSSLPAPELIAELADLLEVFIERLDDVHLRQTALLKLEGFSISEIAQQMGCIERTVDRRLAVIRRRWRLLSEQSEAGV